VEPQSSQLAQTQHVYPEAPLRLLFDGRKLGDGGIGVYIENTVRGLLDTGEVHVTVIASPAQAERAPWRTEVSWVYDSSKQYSVSEYLLLPRRIDFSPYDLYHAPHFTLPFGIPIPAIVTVHDLIHIEHPEAFYYPVVARRLIRSAVARASRVVAVSQDTRRRLLRLTAAEPHKIVHIPNAIPSFVRYRERSAATNFLKAGERYFVTVVSNCKPHKGVADLVHAWRDFAERHARSGDARPSPKLLLVGYGSQALEANRTLRELVASTPGIRIIGAVDNDLLRHLYCGAEALVVPSLAEGFCFPALEAQSVGTRVICRPIAALQELITENDLVAHDLSVDALTQALLASAATPKYNKLVIDAHLERFALPRTSKQLQAVYSSAVGGNRTTMRLSTTAPLSNKSEGVQRVV
jgi:glycosyltransferase involved in cell wall biosynthesis